MRAAPMRPEDPVTTMFTPRRLARRQAELMTANVQPSSVAGGRSVPAAIRAKGGSPSVAGCEAPGAKIRARPRYSRPPNQ
jgi:hypothetical protein